jgi:membrane protease YdiL (CAAX protease family)
MTFGTSLIARAAAPAPTAGTGWLVPVGVMVGLGVIVAARWGAMRSGMDALLVGVAFGLALSALVVVASQTSTRAAADYPRRLSARVAARRSSPVHFAGAGAVGAAIGLGLVAIAIAGPMLAGTVTVPGLGRPAAPFLSWAAVTVLVAAAEEALLRGVLFDGLERRGGLALAVVVTTAVFAVMHVPLYGWHVVPLDLAVGLVLAGLRLSTRTIVAPAAAHAVADLATWWI